MNNNYYDDILEKIKNAYENKEYQKAEFYIEEELSMPYIPSDFEKALFELQDKYRAMLKSNDFKLSDEEIIEYLKADEMKQMLAANYLNNLNIRDYLDIVQEYLLSDSDDKIKVLIINTLMEQDILDEMQVKKDGLDITFVPRYVEPIELSDGYLSAKNYFEEHLKQNPSMLQMADELLAHKCFAYLPFSYEEEEGELIAKEIICYIYDCLGDLENKEIFINESLNELEKKIILEKSFE